MTEYFYTYTDWGAGYLGRVFHYDGEREVQDWISLAPRKRATEALTAAMDWAHQHGVNVTMDGEVTDEVWTSENSGLRALRDSDTTIKGEVS